MKYNKRQLKVINSKKNGFSIIKGSKSTGKTITALERIRKLLSSCCIEKDDNIIMIVKNQEKLKNAKSLYEKIQCEQFYQESFFEKTTDDCFKIQTLDNIAFSLFNLFKNRSKNNSKYRIISKDTKCEILYEIINALKNNESIIKKYNVDISHYNIKVNKKYLNKYNIEFLINEIKYIKAFNYTIDEYAESNRKKFMNMTLRKKSQIRYNIYSIMDIYNFIMKKMFFIDGEDLYLIALKEAEKSKKKYTHIFADNYEEYTKVQILLIEQIIKFKFYSNVTYIMNNETIQNETAYLKYNKNLNEFGHDFRGKTTILKEIYNYENIAEPHIKNLNNDLRELNNKTYIDLKHNRIHTFVNDDDNKDDIYITDMNNEEKAEDICVIPVFNEIAAGKPILINEHLEDTYCLPKEWIKGAQSTFILKIQGDSMIGKNIEDGDLVVLDSTKGVYNNDIVAVEFAGEATLKTFKREDNRILFNPENPKYSPIVIYEGDEFNILGVAVGIIKNSN